MSKKEAIQAADYDEEMTVTMELEDGESVTCAIITILTVNEKDYIILLPLDEKGENEDGEVWIYGYKEDESDPNAEPELFFIEDEDEYDAVSHAFDEYLDQVEFDELIDESSKGSRYSFSSAQKTDCLFSPCPIPSQERYRVLFALVTAT